MKQVPHQVQQARNLIRAEALTKRFREAAPDIALARNAEVMAALGQVADIPALAIGELPEPDLSDPHSELAAWIQLLEEDSFAGFKRRGPRP